MQVIYCEPISLRDDLKYNTGWNLASGCNERALNGDLKIKCSVEIGLLRQPAMEPATAITSLRCFLDRQRSCDLTYRDDG